MNNPLLDRVLPAELADRNQAIDFKGGIGSFGRLAGIVEADLAAINEAERPREWQATPVATRLEFAWLDARREVPRVEGRVSARVTMVCQRCLEAFEMPIETEIRMLLVGPEGSSGKFAEMADYESWELEEKTLRPIDMVEESLIMAMPLAPMHESQDSCGPLAKDVEEERAGTVRPFANLKSQMENTND